MSIKTAIQDRTNEIILHKKGKFENHIVPTPEEYLEIMKKRGRRENSGAIKDLIEVIESNEINSKLIETVEKINSSKDKIFIKELVENLKNSFNELD